MTRRVQWQSHDGNLPWGYIDAAIVFLGAEYVHVLGRERAD